MVATLRATPVKRTTRRPPAFGKSLVREYPGVGRALSLEADLTMCQQWPQNAKKKRNHRLHMPSKNPGSILLRKHEEGGTEGKSITYSFSTVPEEIVEEILSRLPVKSLARFSCLSKSLCHLIGCEGFVSLHAKNYKTSHLFVCSSDGSHDECSMSFVPGPTLTLTDAADSQKVVKANPLTLGGTCNGIVCLYMRYAGIITLWNPVTKDFKNIPKCDVPRPRQYGVDPVFITVGLGFDPKKNDYKILQMSYVDYETDIIELKLYSLRDNSWRKIKSPRDFNFHVSFWTSNLVCNVHWMEYRVICALIRPLLRPSKWEILSFDVSSEMFDILEISSSLEAELSGGGDKCVKLFPFKGSLALSNNYHQDGSQKQIINLWVLNHFCEFNNNNNNNNRCWSKLYSIEVGIGPRIIGSWENHILFYDRATQKLGRFDIGKQEEETVSWPGGMATSTVYTESLVRVSDINRENENGKMKMK